MLLYAKVVFACPLRPGTYMDMMYMPDALRACVELMELTPPRLIHRNSSTSPR